MMSAAKNTNIVLLFDSEMRKKELDKKILLPIVKMVLG